MSHDVELRKEKQSLQSSSDIGASAGECCSACQIHGNVGSRVVSQWRFAVWHRFFSWSRSHLFGLSLGALAGGAMSLVAVLACPVGMFLMMRLMMKNKN